MVSLGTYLMRKKVDDKCLEDRSTHIDCCHAVKLNPPQLTHTGAIRKCNAVRASDFLADRMDRAPTTTDPLGEESPLRIIDEGLLSRWLGG